MHLSESEAKTILRARKLVKQRHYGNVVSLVVLLSAFALMIMQLIEPQEFAYLAVLICMLAVAGFPLARKQPSYKDLLELLERKASENKDSIQLLIQAGKG